MFNTEVELYARSEFFKWHLDGISPRSDLFVIIHLTCLYLRTSYLS